MSKWDNISRVNAKELMERIVFLDVERSSGLYMEMSMNGKDIYKDQALSAGTYFTSPRDSFEFLGTEVIYSKQHMIPTCAEVLHQLPRAYAHKIDAFRTDIFATAYKDIVEDAYRISVDFFKRKKPEVVRTGPLSARELYIDLIKGAMEPSGERPGVLNTCSLSDATRNIGQMKKLREMLVEAEHMDEDKISDAVMLFCMNAFKQR